MHVRRPVHLRNGLRRPSDARTRPYPMPGNTPPPFSREIAVPASPGLPPALSDPRTLRTAPWDAHRPAPRALAHSAPGTHTGRHASIRKATHRPAPHRGHPRRGGGRGRPGVRPRPPGTGRTGRHGQPVLHFQSRRGSPRNDARRPSEILVKSPRRKRVNGTPPSLTESKWDKLGF